MSLDLDPISIIPIKQAFWVRLRERRARWAAGGQISEL